MLSDSSAAAPAAEAARQAREALRASRVELDGREAELATVKQDLSVEQSLACGNGTPLAISKVPSNTRRNT